MLLTSNEIMFFLESFSNSHMRAISKYCKFGNFREDFIFAKLCICEVS